MSRSVRPPLTQCWMWCRSTRRDSQPGNRHRPWSRSRAARRIAELGLRRRRPRASTAPPSPWVIHDSAAVQAIICAVDTLIAGPSSTWQRAGSAGSPIRVSARTFAYDSVAAANRARITGRSRRARATRTCSRAVPDDIWHFHDSHCAQLFISHDAQPRRASKSPSRTRNRHVAAARCPASSQIRASTRSNGTAGGSTGDAAASADGETEEKTEPGLSVSNMYSRLARGSDIPAALGRGWRSRGAFPRNAN